MASYREFLGPSHAPALAELMQDPAVMTAIKHLLHAREALIARIVEVAKEKKLPIEHVNTAEKGTLLREILDKIEQANQENGTPLVSEAALLAVLKDRFGLNALSGIKPAATHG